MEKICFATVLKACNFIKKRLQHGRFPVSIPKCFRDNFFYRTTTVAALELFKYQKEFLTKKVSGKIAFDLISLFHKYKSLQEVQLPQEHFSFLQNFIIAKYLKQEVNDDRSICMDKRSPCGLSMTGDTKIYQYYVMKK